MAIVNVFIDTEKTVFNVTVDGKTIDNPDGFEAYKSIDFSDYNNPKPKINISVCSCKEEGKVRTMTRVMASKVTTEDTEVQDIKQTIASAFATTLKGNN